MKMKKIYNNLQTQTKKEKIQDKMKSLFKIYMIQKFNNHIKILSKKKDQIAFSNFLNRIQLLKKIK